MAVASRLAVARVVSPDGGAGSGRAGRPGFAAAARRGRRRGGAVAASPPTEEVAQMTEPLTKEDLVAYLASGCKPKENWR
jgi:glutamate--cysteine ligase